MEPFIMFIFTLIIATITKLLSPILGIGTAQNFPPALPQEEEKVFFKQMREGGAQGEDARQVLILHNLRLVSHIVRKYYSGAKSQEDLVSIGTIGLIKAVDSFNIHLGAKFATYAAKCIQNEILMYFRSQKKLASEISINETIDVDRDGNPLTYIDVVCCDEDIAEEIDRKLTTEKMIVYVEKLLSPRERQIIMMRYGLGGIKAQTQREIAQSLGISRSYVSRIEKAALSTLRDALK